MTGWELIHHIGPAIAMLVGAGVVLTADVILPRGRGSLVPLTLLSLGIAAVWALWHAIADTDSSAFQGAVVMDSFAIYFILLLTIVAAAVVVASLEWAKELDLAGEFYALLLVATGSMSLLVQGNDLILIFIALETTSIAQYVLVGITRRDRAAEAGIKYLLNGAIAAGLMIYGFAFLFGVTGSTSLDGIGEFVRAGNEAARLPLTLAFVLIAAGFGFKMALAPFHGWAPDVYEGGPTPVVSFLAVASKAGGFAIALRLFYTGLGGGDTIISQDWAMMFGVFAVASMLFGNIAALLQTDARRLLGYSSIAQAGNIGVGLAAVAMGSTLGASGVIFFLGTYVATNLGAFFAVIAISERIGSYQISDYAGLIKRSPMLSAILVLCLLSLTGIPPTAGFIAKVYIFNSAVQTGEQWLVAVVAIAVINTAISAFYYLRWARTIVLEDPVDETRFSATGPMQAMLAVAAIGVIFLGVVPSPLLNAAQRAAAALL
ncbi:MAG: NADH-quinone oxidoreductase subunit N [Dehalococcoidia bacterium]|jgi:NADH-quinone oxidoreductase subunit N|nr:NADH-quinone oxidoreductase subunit N [Dehalococcoidia bacterium]